MGRQLKKIINEKIAEIKQVVGGEIAIGAVSGGVDSSVCAVLGAKALGKNFKIVFLDDGLMRAGEPERVKKIFNQLGFNLKIVRVSRRFFQALRGIEDPEKKRMVFRETFYQTLGEIVKQEKAKFLLQGTIKADIIEIKGGVKTQHNVLEQIGLDPKKYGLFILEPLRDLFKPEVRKLAQALGLPREIYQRMPFPGPGLATRIIGEVTPGKVAIVRQAHVIVEKELVKFKPFQCFAVLLKDKATGVKKGKRIFGDIIAVRSVDSQDAMTATVTKISWPILEKIQKKICRQIPSVVKVVFDMTPKPPSTIEYI